MGSADLTPRTTPAVDRRRPEPHPEAIPLHPEAASDAIAQARLVFAAGQGLANAVIIGALAFARKLREVARRGAYPLPNGDRLAGIHPADVHSGLLELVRWGGCEGPNAEDAFARALAKVDALRDERAQKAALSPYHRRASVRERVEADLERARDRARTHLIVSGGQR